MGADFGAKAAALAFCTACILFIELLPNSDGPNGVLATLVSCLTGALLAPGAGWYWTSSETDGAPWLYMRSVFFLVAIVMIGLKNGLLVSVLTVQPKRAQREQFSSTTQDELSEEYERFRKALGNEATKHGEIVGCNIALERNLANLLLFLRSDPKNGLNQEKLVHLIGFADLKFDGEPAGVATQSQHRRLRMMVRGALGESSQDP